VRYLKGLLPLKYNKLYSAADQAVLSAISLIFSLMVVRLSGVENFGVYSFVFLLCQLSASITGTLIIRQMVLHISNATLAVQRRVFADTLFIMFLFYSLKLIILVGVCIVFDISANHHRLIFSACIYAFSLETLP